VGNELGVGCHNGVALYDSGKRPQGLRVLQQALTQYPNDPDLLDALAAYARDPSR
jgi:Flp pilus assembly protein TadD